MRKYLSTLARRNKRFHEARSLKDGELLIIMDNSMPRNNWIRGMVVATYHGKDGQIRVVDVKPKCGIFKPLLTKLYKLDVYRLLGTKEFITLFLEKNVSFCVFNKKYIITET